MEPLQTPVEQPRCARCGAAVEEAWTFCGACGAPVGRAPAVVVPIAPHVSLEPERRQRLPTRWVVVGLAMVIALLAGVFVKTDLGTRHDRDATHTKLVAERARTAELTKQLSTTSAALNDAKTALAAAQRERDAATAQVAAVTAELNGVRNTLTDAQSRLNLQASQISTLKTCLNGVMLALNYVSEEDYPAAGGALDAVQYSCEEASNLF